MNTSIAQNAKLVKFDHSLEFVMSATEKLFNLPYYSLVEFQGLIRSGAVSIFSGQQKVILFPVISDPIILNDAVVYNLQNRDRHLIYYDGEIIFVYGPNAFGFWEGEII